MHNVTSKIHKGVHNVQWGRFLVMPSDPQHYYRNEEQEKGTLAIHQPVYHRVADNLTLVLRTSAMVRVTTEVLSAELRVKVTTK